MKKILLLLITASLMQQFVQGQDSGITESKARNKNIEIVEDPTMTKNIENKDINYIENNGNKIAYCDTGSGNTTIILVSGLTLGLDTWKDLQQQLSKHARVISYDRNGLGNSDYIPNSKNMAAMTGELDVIINHLDLNSPIILIGHSVGGYIVRKYTELFPEKVKALFLIDAYHELFYKELKNSVTEKMWSDYVGNWESIKNNVSSGIADEIGFTSELMKSDERYIIPSDIPVYLFTSIKEVPIEEKFVEFNKMAFKVHLRLNNQLDKEYGNLTHIITDKSSHYIYLEEPELIMNEVVALLNN
ncbi:alpha/beta fold hydrolase [Prevotella sp. 10(H)]|uniref:alpha/beta fold hydrolase n=1 Tax=Prevotella sp. 10(H) TaxID=1158294 RepID=UPI0004A6E04E|nr:alpha/beta hydrolase [Prevotella sp. 10(H)]